MPQYPQECFGNTACSLSRERFPSTLSSTPARIEVQEETEQLRANNFFLMLENQRMGRELRALEEEVLSSEAESTESGEEE